MSPVRWWFGLVFLAMGVLAILDATGTLAWSRSFEQWWPVAIVGWGVADMLADRHVSLGGTIIAVIGFTLLADQQQWTAGALVWSALFLLVGAAILLPHSREKDQGALATIDPDRRSRPRHKPKEDAMHLTRKDRLATVFAAAGAMVYALWLAGAGSREITGVRVVTGVVLALGVAASASAVVPGFDGLLHGSKTYLASTSLIGLGAFVAGIVALVTGHEVMLAVLVVATVVLWAISTVRHTSAAVNARGLA